MSDAATDTITLWLKCSCWMVKLVTPIFLEPNLENSCRCYLATIANY